ncbi:MAG: biotin--[acetyl-CoA-carboxylase] ligase [Actinomycetota bacterium]
MQREPFDPLEFERLADGVAWVREVHAFAQTGSTNDEAARLARKGAPEGTVVVADVQTAGRGRLDRAWVTEPGTALMTSFVVRFAGPSADRPLLTLATAVAAARAIERTAGVDVRLKWPNDLLASRGKLGGILAEAVDDAVVIGLGVNVRQSEFPPELASIATSLLRERSRPVGRGALLGAILDEFAPYAARPRDAMPEYRSRCATIGREVRVSRSGGRPVEGTATAVDDAGALRVRTAGGDVAITAGDVVHVR